MIRKNISLDETYLQVLEPLLDKHRGNLSAAVRDAIELAGLALENYGTSEKAVDSLKTKEKGLNVREALVRDGECVLLSQQTISWLISNADGRILDDDIVYELINPYKINTMSDLGKYLNERSRVMGWKIRVSISWKGEDADPECTVLSFCGGSRELRELMGEIVSIFMARWMGLDVDAAYRKFNSITIHFKKFVNTGPWQIPPGVLKYFGSREAIYKEIEKKPEYWNTLIGLYRRFNYQRVNIDRKLFEVFAAGDVPDIKKYLETVDGRPINEIPLSDLLQIFKKIVTISQFVDDVKVSTEKGKEYVKIRHDYSSEKVISTMVQLFSDVFRAGWHTFRVRLVSNLIIFEFDRPAESNPEERIYSLSAEELTL